MDCKWLLANAVFLCFFVFSYTTANRCNNCFQVNEVTCLEITKKAPFSVIFTLKVCSPELCFCDDCWINDDISCTEMNTTEPSLQCLCETTYCTTLITYELWWSCLGLYFAQGLTTPEICNCGTPARIPISKTSSTTGLRISSTPTHSSVITSTSTSPFSPTAFNNGNQIGSTPDTDKDMIIGIVVGVGGLILIIILIIVAVIILRKRRTKPSSLTVMNTRNTMLPNSCTVNGNLYSDPIVVAPYEALTAASTQPPPPPTYTTLMSDGVRGETEPSAPSYDNAACRSDEEIRHMNEVRAEGPSSNYNYDNIQTSDQQPTTGSDETILIENNLYRH